MPNDPNLIKLRAGFYLEEDQADDALRLLHKSDTDPECLLMTAEILAVNNPVAALHKLREVEQIETATQFHRITAICLRINAWLVHPELCQAERVTAAEKEYSLLQKLFPDSPLTSIVRAQILQASNEDPVVVKQVLTDAKAVLTENTPFYERFLLAKKTESIEGYTDVADLLDGHVDASHDSPALRTLLIALLNSDQRSKAYKLLSEIPAKIAEQPLYLRAAISLHLRRGDYRAAEDAATRLIQLIPADLQTHLTRVDIRLRRRDERAVKDFLETAVEQLHGEPEQMMRLAHLLARFGFEDRALKLGYTTHLKNRKDPQVQLAYMGLLLNPGLPRTVNLEKTVVECDAEFSIKNDLGATETFVIESDESLNLTDETIPPNHMFATAAQGLAVGETFTVKGVTWEITNARYV
jgi:tetratricopeptide (TPR) repeat protein